MQLCKSKSLWSACLLSGWAIASLVPVPAVAQIAGNRGGDVSMAHPMETLSVETINSHIKVEGSSQVRVKPTAIRMIWAVTTEASTATECRTQMKLQLEKTRSAFLEMGMEPAKVVEDFIAAIPTYEYKVEQQNEERVLVEKQTGYRMQTNLHVAVNSDEQARQVIEAAIASGINDLIGVDYSAELEQAKQQAMAEAVAAAKNRADILLAVMDSKPRPINVQSSNAVYYPDQLYDSFEKVAGQSYRPGYRDNLRSIEAFRPQNTYLRGLSRDADQRTYQLVMYPEIVVECKVVIYYQSPAAEDDEEEGEDDDDQ